MMNRTKIEWTDFTWNPVTGCYHGCEYCYARRIAHRFAGCVHHKATDTDIIKINGKEHFENTKMLALEEPMLKRSGDKAPYPIGFRPTFHKYRLHEPVQRQKPAKIFVCSMGDLFGEWVPKKWIEKVIEVAENCPQHTFQFLTKNPERYQEFDFPNNCWLGTTIEADNSHNVFERYWGLYPKRENIQFVSFEPLLGKEDLNNMFLSCTWLDWVIIGAQTGPGAVSPEHEWIEIILRESDYHGIPVFMKNNLDNFWSGDLVQEWPEGLK
ncbi:MAG: DUF5131 family protein [Bacteroidota bacterium]